MTEHEEWLRDRVKAIVKHLRQQHNASLFYALGPSLQEGIIARQVMSQMMDQFTGDEPISDYVEIFKRCRVELIADYRKEDKE